MVTKRQPATSVAAASAVKSVAVTTNPAAVAPAPVPAAFAPASAPAARSAMLLEALKEELFQLEVEKKQGRITPEDYEKAKAALDQTLDRALKRQG